MKSPLILITAYYPYNQSETFVEQELLYLAQSFEVTIISRTNQIKTTREVPNNVKVVNFPSKISFINNLLFILQLIFTKYDVLKSLYHFEKNEAERLNVNLNFKLKKKIVHDAIKSLYFSHQLEDFIKEQKFPLPPILYSYWMGNDALGVALCPIKTVKIAKIHGGDLFFDRKPLHYQTFQQFKLNHLDRLYFVSDKGKEYWEQTIGKSDKLEVCKLSTPVQFFLEPNENRSEKLIVSCANIIPLKRLDFMVKALAQVKNISFKWVHFGDGTERKTIEQLAQQELGNKPNIQFEFKGRLPNAEILNYYIQNSSDLFIHTSETEGGCPVAIQEAISFGIPVIAVDAGGVGEVVSEKNGFLLPINATPEEFAQQITTFFEKTPEERNILRKNSFALWNENHHPVINNHRFINSIKRLIVNDVQ